jgi:GNAT superfamily N-acetyltransferase
VAVDAEQQLEFVELRPELVDEAVGVLARGMRANPLHVAAFGPDPDRRGRILVRMFSDLFRVMSRWEAVCARRDGVIVAVAGHAENGACAPTTMQMLRLTPGLLAHGPRTAVRSSRWMATWAKRDPQERHSHFGPFAVDSHLQGQGIGTVLLTDHCGRLDARGELSYLETDKPENVRLYERHGFQVVDEAEVLGVPNWFMRRPAAVSG